MPFLIRDWFTTPHPVAVVERLFPSSVFLLYGTIQLTGGQFVYDWQQETFVRGSERGHTIIRYFFGHSRAYGTFIALGEIVPAVLLPWHRTARLGARVLLAVSVNIAVMDAYFGIPLPATLSVIIYALWCGALLWRYRRELMRGLYPAPAAR